MLFANSVAAFETLGASGLNPEPLNKSKAPRDLSSCSSLLNQNP